MSIGYLLTQGVGAFTVGGTTSELIVVNRALLMLGEKKIDSLADTNKRAVAANELYPAARDAVLELGLWKSARKLATLVQDDIFDISSYVWNSSVATITIPVGHGILVGEEITVAGTTSASTDGYDITADVTVSTSTTIKYAVSADPGIVSIKGTVYRKVVPNWKYGNQFSMPSDFIRLAKIEDERVPYEIHGNKMVTDESVIKMEYIYKQTDTSDMNQALRDTISAKLAFDLSFHLDTSKAKQEAMERLFARNLTLAKNIDSSQRPDDTMQADELTLARYGSDPWFRTFA